MLKILAISNSQPNITITIMPTSAKAPAYKALIHPGVWFMYSHVYQMPVVEKLLDSADAVVL